MTEKYQLKNGMRVILNKSHRAPVVSVQIWIKTGSADETKKEAGLSHFIEHLLFKGTEKYKVGEIAKIVEGAGGELNAYTSFDQTVYYVTISSKYVDLAIDVLSQMINAPTFDDAEVDNEREVVIEEIKRGEDSPHRSASKLMFSTVYSKHPYGRPVIGYPDVVNKTSKNKIKNFFHKRYTPKNSFVILSGDFETERIKKLITDKFSGFQGKLHPVKRNSELPYKKNVIKVERSKFSDTHLNLCWKLPEFYQKRPEILDTLSLILGGGESSRLFSQLRLQSSIVKNVSCGSFKSLDQGFLAISATLETSQLQATLDAIANELVLAVVEGFGTEELRRAINNMEATEFYGQESVENISRRTGQNQLVHNDCNYFEKYISRMRSLKLQSVEKALREILTQPFVCTALTDKDKTKVKKIISQWEKSFLQSLEDALAVKKSSKHPEKPLVVPKPFRRKTALTYKKETTSKGIHVIWNPLPETEVVNVQVGFRGGLLGDSKGKEGTGEMLSNTWLSGAEGLNEAQLIFEMEKRSSQIQPFSGRNTHGLTLETLSVQQKDMSELFLNCLVNPKLSDEVFLREKKHIELYLKNEDDRPTQKLIRHFQENMFRHHPYALNPYGTPETLKNINLGHVKEFYSTFLTSQNTWVVLSGALDQNIWQQWLEKLDQQIPEGKSFNEIPPIEPLVKPVEHFSQLNKEQSHIALGYRGLPIGDNDHFTMKVIKAILAGQGGRLFLNLRDRNSLAYTVAPMALEGLGTGYFGAYIGCSPEKSQKAIAMMKAEFQQLVHHKVDHQELERAKRYILGSHDIQLQRTKSTGAKILFNEIYGIAGEEALDIEESIISVTPEKIQSLSQRLFTQDPVICVVGKESPF